MALDVLINKLRFAAAMSRASRVQRLRLRAAVRRRAVAVRAVRSQVIEHVPMVPSMIDELLPRARSPAAGWCSGTPDYDRWEWVWMEKAYGDRPQPGGYADEHISPLHAEGTCSRTSQPWLRARGDALHPARRADPRVPEARADEDRHPRHRVAAPSSVAGLCSLRRRWRHSPAPLTRAGLRLTATSQRFHLPMRSPLPGRRLRHGDTVLWTAVDLRRTSTC